VLNLAGNKIRWVDNLSSLQSLTELNLRRNMIESVSELDKLPTLQRVFLSHNKIARFLDIQCIFNVKFLIELSLDGNPVADVDGTAYRNKVIGGMPGLRHLDLQRISEDDRAAAVHAEQLVRIILSLVLLYFLFLFVMSLSLSLPLICIL
jgi:leucine-rich repeat-containing protein 49